MSYNNTYGYPSGQTYIQPAPVMPAQKTQSFAAAPASLTTDSNDMLRRFQYFDRNQDGLLSRDEVRALMMSLYGEHPPQAMIDTVDEHLFLNDASSYDFQRAMDLANKVRSKNYSAVAPTPKPAVVSTPFGTVQATFPSSAPNTFQQTQMYPSAMVPYQQPTSTTQSTPMPFQQPSSMVSYQQPAPVSQPTSMVPYQQPLQATSQAFPAPAAFASTPFDSASSFFPSATSSLPSGSSAGFAAQPSSFSKTASTSGQSMAAALNAAGGLPSAARVQSGKSTAANMPSIATAGTHYISKEEQRAFTEYINTHPILSQDRDLKDMLPLNPTSDDLYVAVASGVLFCKFLNAVRPETVPSAQIKLRPRSIFEQTENQTLAIAGARKLGCSVVNIGPSDLIEGKAHLVLGMIWQIIRVDLLSKVTVQQHPELCRLIGEGNAATGEAPMSLQQMQQISPEQVLLRWLNHHLRNAGYNKSVNNFSSDIQDGSAYTVLLNKLAPELISLDGLRQDAATRANNVCATASRLGCGKFVTPGDIMSGNARLNLAFVADLFNRHPGIDLPSMEELERLRRQNAAMASVLAEAEARLRQLAVDRHMAEELQNQEIIQARQREAERQREIAEGEAYARAAQEAEERNALEENDRRTAEMLQNEAYLQREMSGAQQHRQVPQPQPQLPSQPSYPRAAPAYTASGPSSISYNSSTFVAPVPRQTASGTSSSRSSSYNSGSTLSAGHSSSKKKGLFERAGHKVDKKLTQFKDVQRYN